MKTLIQHLLGAWQRYVHSDRLAYRNSCRNAHTWCGRDRATFRGNVLCRASICQTAVRIGGMHKVCSYAGDSPAAIADKNRVYISHNEMDTPVYAV